MTSYRRLGLALLASAPIALVVAMPATAAPATPSNLYHCQPKGDTLAPPPAPVLSSAAKAEQSAAVAADDFAAVCPAGQVPYPSATPGAGVPKVIPPAFRMRARLRPRSRPHRHAHRRRPRAAVARQQLFGYWYSWAQGGAQHFAQGANVYAQFASQTVEQPYIDYTHGITAAHSLAQLWTMAYPDPTHYSDVETGWIEDAGQYNDTVPHLFIAAFDYNTFLGYVGQSTIPWVQYSSVAFPNMSLPASNTTSHTFGTELSGGVWWLYYDGQWVGYIPQSAWHTFFPNSVTDIAAGGEVATPEQNTCTDMGYAGRFGTNSGAASFTTSYYLGAGGMHNTAFAPYASDPASYNTGNWIGGYSFKYGGPGVC